MKFKLGWAYYVQWHDASGSTEWTPLEQLQQTTLDIIHTVGIVISANKQRIVFGSSYGQGNGKIASSMNVPRANVIVAKALRQIIVLKRATR